MTLHTVETVVSADVASGSTVSFSYPSGTNAGTFENTRGHKLWVDGHQRLYDYPGDFTLSFGTSSITATYNGSTSIPADSRVVLQVNELRALDDADLENDATEGVIRSSLAVLDLGAPDALDADGIATAQAVAAAGNLTLNGALVAGGEAVFDVPRGVQIVSTGAGDTTQTATFTGEDEFGNTVVESVGFNGTTAVSGKKAFKKVTQVAISAALAGNGSAGTTDVLGLPVRLPDTGYVLAELEDGAAATAGTVVAADDSAATATTGDVRGSYDPNSACDGSKAFKLIAALPDLTDKGASQYAG